MKNDDDEALTPAAINQLCWEAEEGAIAPNEARELLKAFRTCVETRQEVPPRLLAHLSRAFGRYLHAEETLDRALGLTRKRGRPSADEDMRSEMAAEVLRRRLAGTVHQDALKEVSYKYGWTESVVGEAWAKHRHAAMTILRVERAVDGEEWTMSERSRLCEIYGFDPFC